MKELVQLISINWDTFWEDELNQNGKQVFFKKPEIEREKEDVKSP